MAFSVSPGVNVSEVDLTIVVPAVSSTVGAFAGVFSWGPAEERVLVSSEKQLVARFGKPNGNNFETFYTAANFLAYGDSLYVSRAVDDSSKNAQANVSAAATTLLIKNKEDFDGASLDANAQFYARYAGSLGNSLKISVCDSAAAFESTISEVGVLVTAVPGSSTVTVANTDGTTVDAINIGDLISIDNRFLKVVAKSTVTGNTATLTIDGVFTGSANVVVEDSLNRFWEFYNSVSAVPGTSAFVEAAGGTADELHVVVVDEDGLFSGQRGAILERFESLSRASDARGPEGGSIYYKDVINEASQYVYVGAQREAGYNTTAATSTTLTADTPLTVSFTGGIDAAAEASVAISGLVAAWDVFKNAEEVDVSLLLAGKAIGVNGVQLANYLIDNIAEYRRDCVVFISPEYADVVNQVDAVSNVIGFRNNLRSSSYAVLDSGYKYQYDRYNDVNRWIPLNGDIAGLCARTDETRDPWFSPAGFNRGQIKNILKLAFNPDKAGRDALYKKDVNPVVTFPGQGTVLYGDKTLFGKPSAFDRINVRRLFIVLEKAIATASKFSLFEFNDEFTRAQFRSIVEPYLRDIQGRRGIFDFRVVCDETNNTAEIVDQNEFVGDIFIKPARSINFIQLNFVAIRSGVEFTEVVGQF
jgi:phage tail sheath protein FI